MAMRGAAFWEYHSPYGVPSFMAVREHFVGSHMQLLPIASEGGGALRWSPCLSASRPRPDPPS
eukprot:1162020-Pyramimonas_sp.AAC.1